MSNANRAISGQIDQLIQSLDQELGERYKILGLLGRGGMGVVLKARHAKLNKTVAIKVLAFALTNDELSQKRFEIEAQANSALSHPNLVSCFDYGFAMNNNPYLVMEYIEGQSLDKLIPENGTLAVAAILDIIIQICKALQYVHERNIIHRDLKSSNIVVQMISGERYAKLLDFGLAKLFTETGESMHKLTATGDCFGTPVYMSPEQCMGVKVDLRSDVYSIGCIIYECMSGRPPFLAADPLIILMKHTKEAPAPLSYNTEAERELAEIVCRCLEKSPDDRYQSAKEVLADLKVAQSFLTKEEIEEKPVSAGQQIGSSTRTRKESESSGSIAMPGSSTGSHGDLAARSGSRESKMPTRTSSSNDGDFSPASKKFMLIVLIIVIAPPLLFVVSFIVFQLWLASQLHGLVR